MSCIRISFTHQVEVFLLNNSFEYCGPFIYSTLNKHLET